MPLKIGRYPAGFLGLLDSKNIGRTPADLEDLVRPMVDISPFYLQQQRRVLEGFTSTINAVGSWGAAGVGPGRGQIAFVWSCSCTRDIGLAAGTTYKFAFQVNVIDDAKQIVLTQNESFTASELVNLAGPMGFWMPANSQLGVRAAAVTLGTAVGMTVRADISIIDL